MKDICKIFIILLFFTSCLKKSEKVETEKVLDTVSKIKILKFEKSKAVIFPANYWKKPEFANIDFTTENTFFTPDEETVRHIETLLPKTESIIYAMWKGDSNVKANHMNLYDKQYFGYVDEKNDSIIAVRVFNLLDSYPKSANNKFDTELNSRVCGWYNFNTIDLSYSLKLKGFKEFN